jgi:hypothetical protein
MTKGEAAQVVAMLAAGFPGARFGEENAAVYEAFLSDLEFGLASAAITGLVNTSRFLPSIAEIRAACLDSRDGKVRGAEDAWGDVVSEIRRVGAYGAPQLSDPLAAYAVERLGWRNLCGSSNDAADRARFCELYARARDRERESVQSSPGLRGSAGQRRLSSAVAGLLFGVGNGGRDA